MKNKGSTIKLVLLLILTAASVLMIGQAGIELLRLIQENQAKLGRFAFLGPVAIGAIVLGCILTCLIALVLIWQPDALQPVFARLISWRKKLKIWRWLAAFAILVIPLALLQNTILGVYLTGTAFRLIVLIGTGLASAALITSSEEKLILPSGLIVSFLAAAAGYILSQAFATVTTYPFSQYWSEGNRIWDYSVLFGRRFYDFPVAEPIFAYIDLGRQSLWGLPFLFSRAPIIVVRFWSSFLFTIPYAIFGLVVFQRVKKYTAVWLLMGLWCMVFLYQGPIYTPLAIAAILVAIAWRSKWWIGLPLIVLAGYYAQVTRFTWMFAPALWAAMLYLADLPFASPYPRVSDSSLLPISTSPPAERRFLGLPLRRLGLALAAGFAGLLGGYIIPRWSELTDRLNPSAIIAEGVSTAPDIVSAEGVSAMVSRQALLWQRLLPNPTYEPGILLGLILTVGPVIVFLIYLLFAKRWKLDWLGGLAVIGVLSAFLAVGLVVSVKIGGGSNLHNLDMFLIALVFTLAVAWRQGGWQSLAQFDHLPAWLQAVLIFSVVFYAYQPVKSIAPQRPPSQAVTQQALRTIRQEVETRKAQGEVLFLDQRQLLTFGNIQEVPLVDDYEKKYLMDQALSNDGGIF